MSLRLTGCNRSRPGQLFGVLMVTRSGESRQSLRRRAATAHITAELDPVNAPLPAPCLALTALQRWRLPMMIHRIWVATPADLGSWLVFADVRWAVRSRALPGRSHRSADPILAKASPKPSFGGRAAEMW